MKEYIIELSRSQTQEIKVKAESEAEAIALATTGHQDWNIEHVNDRMFMGFDEGTDEPIFSDDNYHTCSETGIMELAKNAKKYMLD